MHARYRANGGLVSNVWRLTPRLYKWEREFLCSNFYAATPLWSRRYPEHTGGTRVRAILLASPYTLIHRDMQSTNILYRGNTPCFIDFQGMRFGPAAYDLASLLCDPYVELPTAYLPKLLTYYNRHLPSERRIMENVFWHAAVERLAQALGAYGRLGAEPATRRFLRFIPPALRQMGTALQQLQAHPVLANTVRQLLEQTDNCSGQRHSI